MIRTWDDLNFWKSDRWKELDSMPLQETGQFDAPRVYPHRDIWFKALTLTPFDAVKVVILGVEPSCVKGVSNGLAYSMQPTAGKNIHASLYTIFKEYCTDLDFPWPHTRDLTKWANNGVLLLNMSLTVKEGEPGSHLDRWNPLIIEIINNLSNRKDPVQFILWGNQAQIYIPLINKQHHPEVITSCHPSPRAMQANKGDSFYGHRPFSRTCEALQDESFPLEAWRLDER